MPRSEPDALAPPWGGYDLSPGEDLELSVGPLRLRARISGDEVWLSHASGDWARPRMDDGDADRAREPGEGEWTRWPVPGDVERIRLIPVLPDRPLVAAPETSFRLLPGATARVYVRVPLWAAVELDDGGRRLTEVPTVILSETWWGSLTEGEFCYWLPTGARRRVTSEAFTSYQVICPLTLANRADEELSVEKIAVRVEHLSVFAADDGFWADETRVRYRGEESGSEIAVGRRPPEEAPDAVLVSPPRTRPPSRAVHARTFARLKALSGMGGD